MTASPQPQLIGHVWRVKTGHVEEYVRRHAAVWPQLEALLIEAGVTTYVIYAWGEIVFSHMEVRDYDKLVRRFDGDRLVERWEHEFADILEYPNADPETGWPERLREVWSLRASEAR